MTGCSTTVQKIQLKVVPGETFKCILEIPELPFNPGIYLSNIAITDGPEFLYRGENPVLEVNYISQEYWGCVSIPYRWEQVDIK